MAPRLRVAAVGLGWVTTHRHLPVMDRDSRYDVVGVIDRNPGLAETLARQRRYRRHAVADDLAAVPWLDEVDAITVGTSPMTHYPVIDAALRLGKHVLTEKPFALTLPEGRSLVESAARSGLCLGIVHNFQFARSMRRLLADLDSGRLGTPRSVSAVQWGNPSRRLPAWYERLPLGLFYDESPHFLYLLHRLSGGGLSLLRADTVTAPGKATPAIIDAAFQSAAGIPMSIRCNFESPVSEWHLMVFGSERLGIVDLFRDIYLCLPNDGSHGTATVLRTSLTATVQHWWQHLPSGLGHLTGRLFYGNDEVFGRFADAALGQPDRLAPIGPDAALAVLELQHAIVAAARPPGVAP